MNCFEKLRLISEECDTCIWYAKIINFKDLPEELKYEVDYYDNDKDLLLYCEPCDTYKIIEGE